MIMCGEQCACTTAPVVVQVFYNRACNCQSIIGARAATDLVKDDQTTGCSMVKNGSCLHHLYHKGALARCQVILSPDTCENAIHQPDSGSFSRNITADLCHQGDHGDLAQIRCLALHITSGNDQYL